MLHGKRVVVVDDSIVRGTTSRKIVKMLRNAGAREVHLRISSPPTTHPCYYGIDTPTRSELIASSHTPDEIARYITCDSLGYLSRDGMMNAVASVGPPPQGKALPGATYCDACFTGHYPDRIPARYDRFAKARRELAKRYRSQASRAPAAMLGTSRRWRLPSQPMSAGVVDVADDDGSGRRAALPDGVRAAVGDEEALADGDEAVERLAGAGERRRAMAPSAARR